MKFINPGNKVDHQELCRFCSSKDTVRKFFTRDLFHDEWNISQCHSCKAYFLAPPPTNAQLKNAYDASYYGTGERKFIFSVEHFIDFFRRRKARKIASQLPENAKILDLGCGNGRFLKHLSSCGKFELHGIELPGGSAERAAKIGEIDLKVGYIKEKDYPDAYFDAVTLFHVLEHLEDPKKTLEIISRKLKKNGLLVMSFPNIAGWQAKVFKGNWYHLDPPRHLVFFKPADLKIVMQDLGFEFSEINYFSFEQNPYGWTQSVLNTFCSRREFLYEWLKGNRDYARKRGHFRYFLHFAFFIFTFPVFIGVDILESLFSVSATVKMCFMKK